MTGGSAENLLLLSSEFIKQREYWERKLSGYETGSWLLPVVRKGGGRPDNPNHVEIDIPVRVYSRLLKLGKNSSLSMGIMLITAVKILIHRYGDIEDIIVVTPLYKMNISQTTINRQVFIRDQVSGGMSVRELILAVRKSVVEAYENQDYPFEKIREELLPSGAPPLIVTFADLHGDEENWQPEKPGEGLVFSFARIDNRLKGHILFSGSIYDRIYIEQMAGHMVNILAEGLEEVNRRICDISLLTNEERERLLYEFNDTDREYPVEKTVWQLFIEQAMQNPDRAVVVGPKLSMLNPGPEDALPVDTDMISGTISITNRELRERVGSMAGLLCEKGVRYDTVVGIRVERSVEMVIGIFAIWEAGGAYLPIDPGCPVERVKYMLEDSGALVVITAVDLIGGNEKLNIAHKGSSLGNGHWQGNSSPVFSSDSLAYVLYTSGSTGVPKGVMISQRSVVNRLYWLQECYGFNGTDVILQKTPFTFDVSVCELTRWIVGRGRVCLMVHGGEREPEQIVKAISRHLATTVDFVPSMLGIFIDYLESNRCWQAVVSLKWVFVGVEPVSGKLVKRFAETLHTKYRTRLINAYGLTETTIDVLSTECTADGDKPIVPIGKPMANTRAYVINKYNRLQPEGAQGEIIITGESLARGYINQPELTASSFLHPKTKTNPPGTGTNKTFYGGSRGAVFQKSPPGRRRQYKTGDIGFWQTDGSISFIGRRDYQVKIRGHRVELAEIERQILLSNRIKEVVLMVRRREDQGEQEKYLCAYMVPESRGVREIGEFDLAGLRAELAEKLPGHMIPSYFVIIPAIPLTGNEKPDFRKLQDPLAISQWGTDEVLRSAEEKKMAEIWSDMIGINKDRIGRNANFFELGGNSLRATILAAKIQRHFRVRISMAEIYQAPVLKEIAMLVSRGRGAGVADLQVVEKKEYYVLSTNQTRLWIIKQMEPGDCSYNMPGRIMLKQEVDGAILNQVIAEVMKRHEGFRTYFRTVNEMPVQCIREGVEVPLRTIDISALPEPGKVRQIEEIIFQEAGTPFDLTRAPLVRFVLVKLKQAEYTLIFNMHHIISDGWSLLILQKEFLRIYEAVGDRQSLEFEPLRLGYRDFAEWEKQRLSDPVIKEEAHRYWKTRLENRLHPFELPRDYHQESSSKAGAAYRYFLVHETGERLKLLAGTHGTSLFMVMFSLFYLFLARVSGQRDIVVGLPVLGRDHSALHHMVGFFVNTVILHQHIDPGQRFSDFLVQVKGDMLEVLDHQAYPLENVLEDLKMQFPSIHVFFNMFGEGPGPLEEEPEADETYPYHLEEVGDVKFDLVFYVTEYKNGIQVNCTYRKALFKPATIASFMKTYSRIIDFFVNHPGRGVGEYKAEGKRRTLRMG